MDVEDVQIEGDIQAGFAETCKWIKENKEYVLAGAAVVGAGACVRSIVQAAATLKYAEILSVTSRGRICYEKTFLADGTLQIELHAIKA